MVRFELVTRGLLGNGVSGILTIHKAQKNAERGNGEWKNLSLQVSCCFLFISSYFSTYSVSFFLFLCAGFTIPLSLSVVRRYIRYIHSCPVKLDVVPVCYTKHADHLRRENLAGRCS